MFLIENGRSQFFQWDIKQRLIVEDASIEQVHFCNRTDDCSLKREVYNEGGKRIVNVPDILLQDDWRIHVYAWDKNYTKYEEVFDVVKRTKPANYVYTEEEITEFEDLEKRLDEIEKNGVSDERIAEGVAAYLEENPVEAGATAEQAAQIEDNKAAIAELQIEAANHATTAYVDNAVKNVKPDLKGYATETYVDNAIANAQIGGGGGSADLSNYYTKAQTDSRIAEAVENVPQADLTDYATKEYVNDAVAASGSGAFIVNFYSTGYSTYEADKTLNEVLDAAESGCVVVGVEEDNVVGMRLYQLIQIHSGNAYFSYQEAERYNIIEYAESGITSDGGFMLMPEDIEEPLIVFKVNEDANGYMTYNKSYANLASDFDTYGKAVLCVFNSEKTAKHLMLSLVEFSDDDGFVFTGLQGNQYYKLTYDKRHTITLTENELSNGGSVDLDNYYTKSEVDNAIAAEKKVIHGYMDDADVNGETITFDMTAAEMYALGNDLLNYDVILRVGNIYAYTLSIVQTVPNQFVRMTFTATRTDRINYYDIYIRPNGTFDTDNNGEQATVIYEVPSTQGCLPSKTYNLVVQNNQYTLVEQGTAEELPIAMIMAEDVAGQLYQEKPATLENIIAMYGEEALFTLKLVVANEAEAEATIYSIFEVNMAEQTLIFTNGADKQVILNADGSLSYCDITNYATVNQVNTLISEALGVIENGSY